MTIQFTSFICTPTSLIEAQTQRLTATGPQTEDECAMINENEHIINRKVILIQKGYNAARMAREIGVTPQALSQAIRGKTHSLRIHRAICEKLDLPLAELWPELYAYVPKVSHDCTMNDPSI